nr:saccharopine dehydrogenase C-terminal domain-containing protein [uncultured Pseudomonas sp.]
MNVLLLGAGHIGYTIAQLLHDSGDYKVVVADRDAASLATIGQLGIATLELDSTDGAALEKAMADQDAVLNALPYNMAIGVAKAAKNTDTHYFDLTEDVHATKTIMDLAKDAKVAFMPQCGLAPGFIGIAAHSLASRFDKVREVKMRVGALPEFPTNSLKYNLTWSVDGLVNEYCHPCEAIRNGHLQLVQPLEGLEHFSLDGVEYEAFNTSGGLGTLCETLKGQVETLDYKTVRYPGHRDLMKFLLEDLRLSDNQDKLKDILRGAVPSTMQDVVLVFVTVSGLKNGKLVQQVFSRKIFADVRNGRVTSAIQITTAAGICAALDLFRAKQLPQSGFISQEQVSLDDFLANRFGKAYEENTEQSQEAA